MQDDEDPTRNQRQLFPKWSNPLVPWLFIFLILSAGAVTVVAFYAYRSDWWQRQNQAPDQPVLFSHHHHVTELRIDCRFCHLSADKSSFAGMPSTETCMTCHSGVFMDSPMLAPVVESARTGKPLVWTRVYDLEDYVYFDHSAHVHHGIGCTSCHGDIGNQRLTQKAQPLFMTWCLDCHRNPEIFVREEKDIFSPFAPSRSPLPKDHRIELLRHYGTEDKILTDCTSCHR